MVRPDPVRLPGEGAPIRGPWLTLTVLFAVLFAGAAFVLAVAYSGCV